MPTELQNKKKLRVPPRNNYVTIGKATVSAVQYPITNEKLKS